MLANGTVLPPNPRLVFFKGDAKFEVLADGKAVPFEVTPIEGVNQHGPRAYWLSIEAEEASVLRVRQTTRYSPYEFVFRIDKEWSRQPAKLLRSTRHRPESGLTMCPAPNDLYRLSIVSRAVAYRVQWSGETPGQSIVPTHHKLRWARQSKDPKYSGDNLGPDHLHSVDIGVESCIGNSIPHQLLDSGALVELTALYPDGTEESLGRLTLNDGPAVDSSPSFLKDLSPSKKTSGFEAKLAALEAADAVADRADRAPAMTCSSIFLLSFLGTLGLLGLLGVLLRSRPRVAILVGLGLVGVGLAFSPASIASSHFLPALCALVTWLLVQWLRRNKAKTRS
jgi:hypothetical protein